MKTILLVSHVSETPGGPLEKFHQYLRDKYKVYKITHPIVLNSKQASSIDLGEKTFLFKIPSLFQYPLESLYVLFIWYKYFKKAPRINLAICFDSLAYFHTFLLKKLLHIEEVIYYNVDYSKKRFSNIIMNSIYQIITRFSYVTCDYFLSFENKFLEEIDPQNKYAYKNATIPPLVNLKSIKRDVKKIPHSLVYMGAIDYATTDLKPLLKALHRLKKEKVPFTLYVYSKINLANPIHHIIRKLDLDDSIIFCGTADNQTLSTKLLPQYTIGVAPYTTSSSSSAPDHAFMNKGLTGRVVEYIGAGLPVISTRLTNNFKLIDKHQIGFSVVSSKDWYKALKTLLTNQSLYVKYSHNALAFARNYDTDTILRPLFRKILKDS